MSQSPHTSAESLRMCLEFSESRLGITLPNPDIDAPNTAMYSMDDAQKLRNREHMVFGK